jgi:hypothetical protein
VHRLVLGALISVFAVWGGVIGSTNPTAFPDTVEWCLQYGCDGQAMPTPQAWTSAERTTGLIGNSGTGENFFVLQQGSTWIGNLASGMGAIYNGAAFGNTPTQIAATFDSGVSGAGAWIQADFYGSFTASIELFDISFQSLGSYSLDGYSDGNPGTALFIGAYTGTPNVWAAQFDTTASGFHDHDFAIGTLGISHAAAVPEPATLGLAGTALIAFAVFARRKKA